MSCEKICAELDALNVISNVDELMAMEPKAARQILNDAKKKAKKKAKEETKAKKEANKKDEILTKLKNECNYTYDPKLSNTMTLKDLQIKLKEEKAKIKKANKIKGPSKREIKKQALLKQLGDLTSTEHATTFKDAKMPDIRKEIKKIQKANKPKKIVTPKVKVPETTRRLSDSIEGKPDILGKDNKHHLRIAINKETRTYRLVNPNNWTEEALQLLKKAHPDGKVHNKKRTTKQKNTNKVDLLTAQLKADVAAAANDVLNENKSGGGETKHHEFEETKQHELEEDDILSDMSDDEDDDDDDDEPEFPGIEFVKPIDLDARPGEFITMDDNDNAWNEDNIFIGKITTISGEYILTEI